VGQRGLDFEALAADIATEASTALEVSEQIALLDRRIQDAGTPQAARVSCVVRHTSGRRGTGGRRPLALTDHPG
jgi:hypothetical protein